MPECPAEITCARWSPGVSGYILVSLGTCTYAEVKISTPKPAELQTTEPCGGAHAHDEALAWSQAERVFHTTPHAHLGMPGMERTPLLVTTPALRDVRVHHVADAGWVACVVPMRGLACKCL